MLADDGVVLTSAEAQAPVNASTVVVGRRGRHQDHALASWRRSEAVRLRTTGRTYQQIADALGYANRGTVQRIVAQALEAREAESVKLLRQVELDRLEALHEALWPQAMQGDVPSVLAVLRVIDQQARLLGLAEPPRQRQPGAAWPSCQGPATLVVRADDCRRRGCDWHGTLRLSPSSDESVKPIKGAVRGRGRRP